MSIADAVRSSAAHNRQVFLYFGPLTLLVYLVSPNGQLLDIATSFMLKNQLHATPTQVSTFRLLIAIPVYLAFAFGLARDLWSPLGLKDRGFFLIFAPVTAAVFIWMALSPVTYAGLFAGMLLVMIASRFVLAAYQGLLALVAQEQLMSGRLSALWNVVSSLPAVAGAFAAGYVAGHVQPAVTFVLLALLTLLIGAFGWWKPRAVFSHAYDQPQARGADFVGDLRRLVKHRAIYPAVLLMFMFQFAPGTNTPLQFYLSDQLHAPDAIYGYWWGIFAGAFIPVFMLYGYLCQKVSLKKLLWWGTAIMVPQLLPMAFIHSATTALWLAVPSGMMGAICYAALCDLAMRSCPPGLHGTLMMLVAGVYDLAGRGGDLLGARIYNADPAHGFLYCSLATMAVYALMLPVLLLIPKALLATADGERSPELEAELLAEIGAVPGPAPVPTTAAR